MSSSRRDPHALIEARLDEMDVKVAQYYHAKALSQGDKKAIALEKSSKKAADIDKDTEAFYEDEDEDFEEDESTVVPSAKKGAKAKGKGKTKAKAKAAAKAEAPKMKRPAAIDSALSSKFPRVDRKDSMYWGGGRLYKAAGDMVRVYARTKDRKDKRFKFTDSASLNESWKKACSVIANDPRPVL